MCEFNVVGVILVFPEATSPPKSLKCNPAAERSGAKSELEFREAKVKCIQPHPLLLFCSLNASCFPFVKLLPENSSCAQEELALINEKAQ
jgi:hypothetical protein